MPTPKIRAQAKERPFGILQDALVSIFSVPQLTISAVQIPRVIKSW